MTNQITPFGIWLRAQLESSGQIQPGQEYIDLDPKLHASYIKLWEESMKPQKDSGADRPFRRGFITNSDDTNLVYEVDFFKDGTYQPVDPKIINAQGGTARVTQPGKTTYFTNTETGLREQNYNSEYSDGAGAQTIGAYSAGAAVPAPAASQSPTTVNTIAAPTVAPPAQQAPQQAAGFVVGKPYRDANGNSRVYTGANPQDPRDPRNWQ